MSSVTFIGQNESYKLEYDSIVEDMVNPNGSPIIQFLVSPDEESKYDFSIYIVNEGKLFGSYNKEKISDAIYDPTRIVFKNITDIISNTTMQSIGRWKDKFCISPAV
jgi:hypothetical protein